MTSGLPIHLTNAAYTTYMGAMCCLSLQPDTHDDSLKNTFLQCTFENYARNRYASDDTGHVAEGNFVNVRS
jgi:hypothetical protein